MNQPATPIAQFFNAFQDNSSAMNLPAILAQFADVFMAAGPHGAQAVHAADFAAALPRRKQFFESLGSQSTTLVSLSESPLDARYVLVKTQWQMNFLRPDGQTQPVLVDSIYIVDTAPKEFKIIFYLNPHDLMALLKQHGITPA